MVDRAKGVTLDALASVLRGARSPDGAEAVKLEDIIATCRDLDRRNRAAELVELTLAKA